MICHSKMRKVLIISHQFTLKVQLKIQFFFKSVFDQTFCILPYTQVKINQNKKQEIVCKRPMQNIFNCLEIIKILKIVFFKDAIGSASYVVTDTDYDNYGMVCTCQVSAVNLHFILYMSGQCSKFTFYTVHVRLVQYTYILYCTCQVSAVYLHFILYMSGQCSTLTFYTVLLYCALYTINSSQYTLHYTPDF